MHKITKIIQQKINATAAMLPVVVANCTEVHIMKGCKILELNTVTENEGKPIIPERTYKMRFPVQLYYNHKRRLRKAFLKNGFAGVQQYVLDIHSITNQN